MNDPIVGHPMNPHFVIDSLQLDVDEVKDFISQVIMETYPIEDAISAILNGYSRMRLIEMFWERKWFEARDTDRNLLAVASVYSENSLVHFSALMVKVRGIGIGSALTSKSIQWAQEANASEITAHTHPWNIKSQNNLKKVGFEYHATLPDKWKPTGVILEFRKKL